MPLHHCPDCRRYKLTPDPAPLIVVIPRESPHLLRQALVVGNSGLQCVDPAYEALLADIDRLCRCDDDASFGIPGHK